MAAVGFLGVEMKMEKLIKLAGYWRYYLSAIWLGVKLCSLATMFSFAVSLLQALIEYRVKTLPLPLVLAVFAFWVVYLWIKIVYSHTWPEKKSGPPAPTNPPEPPPVPPDRRQTKE